MRISRVYLAVFCAWLLSFMLALKLGAVGNADMAIITQLRLPRAMLATAVGMGLAVSGAVLQALFANPLCEPYTLGISSGSALGAVLAGSLGLAGFVSGVAASSFVGALVFASVLFVIASRSRSGGNFTLVLAGVMLGFLGSSLVALWMAVSDPNGIQSAILWLLGDLSRARLSGAFFTLASVLALTLLLWSRWRQLDAFLMGVDDAASLGLDVPNERRTLILLVSLLVAVCVSASGMIGFVGLVVPHFARRWAGALHFRLLPLCALLGAASLTAADCIARSVVHPYDLPVAVVTALVGAPLFLWLMLSGKALRSSE